MDLPIRCAVNAEAGRSPGLKAHPIKGPAKRVLVVGGGPAGMEAARVLKTRGHSVTLWERKGALGGQLAFASVPPIKAKLRWLVDWLRRELDELSIPCELNREATLEEIVAFGADEVVVATGAAPCAPSIPGIEACGALSVAEALAADYRGVGRKVVVMGGGGKGAEAALFLAERGEEVTVVEMLDELIGDFEPLTGMDLRARLAKAGARLLTGTRIVACQPNGLSAVDRCGRTIFVAADKLVVSLGYRPKNELVDSLAANGRRAHAIGDCRAPRKIIDAIGEAYDVAARI